VNWRAGIVRCFGLLLLVLALSPLPVDSQNSGIARSDPSAKDSSGKSLHLASFASRIVSMSPGATEALFAIGAGARIVGRSPRCDFPDEALSIPLIAEESSGLIAAAALVSSDAAFSL